MRLHVYICFCVEFLLISAAVFLSTVVRFAAGSSIWQSSVPYIPHAFLMALVCQICMYYADLYDFRKAALSNSKLFTKLLRSLGVAILVLAVLFFIVPSLEIGRGVFLLSLIFAFSMVAGWRCLYRWVLSMKQFRVNILIIGTGEEAKDLAREVLRKRPLGYEIRGFIGEYNDIGRDVL